MLARQVLHAGKPAFDDLQGLGVEIEVVADALEQGQCFVQLDGCRIQQCIDIVQARFVGRFALQA